MKYFLLLIIILTSCATQKRCEKKFGEFGFVENKTDTIFQTKSIYIPQVKVETIKEKYTLHDTVTVTDSTKLLKLKVWYNNELKRCEGTANIIKDTVLVKVPVIKQSKTKYVNKYTIPIWVYILISSLVIIILLILIKK
jgi:hypothetical protein